MWLEAGKRLPQGGQQGCRSPPATCQGSPLPPLLRMGQGAQRVLSWALGLVTKAVCSNFSARWSSTEGFPEAEAQKWGAAGGEQPWRQIGLPPQPLSVSAQLIAAPPRKPTVFSLACSCPSQAWQRGPQGRLERGGISK